MLMSVISIIVLIFGAYLTISFHKMTYNSFYANKLNLVNVTLANVVIGMEFDQRDYLQQLLHSLGKNQEYAFSAIFDKTNHLIVAHSSPTPATWRSGR